MSSPSIHPTDRLRRAPILALIALLGGSPSLHAQATAIQWTGANGTFWSDEGNWSPPGAPRTNGRFPVGFIVNGASELVYDSTLGSSVYGGVGVPALAIGSAAGTIREPGTLKITGGTFSSEGSSGPGGADRIGALGGRFIIEGGTYVAPPLGLRLGDEGKGDATFQLKAGTARIALLDIASPSASVLLGGGALELGRLHASFAPTSGSGNMLVKFGGAKVRATADTVDFLGVDRDQGRIEIGDGGLIVDTAGRKVTITSSLGHSSDSSDSERDGGLIKEGDGALTIGGSGAFTGDIVINRGALRAGFSRNIPNPSVTCLGNTQIARRKIYVNAGGTLDFAAPDSMGSAGSHVKTIIEISRGGLVCNPFRTHTRLGPLVLNGGVLRAEGGPRDTYQAYSLDQSVTVGGSSASSITSNFAPKSGIHLSASTEFQVADATGGPEPDLVVDATFVNCNGTEGGLDAPAALVKSGPGTLRLAAANRHTGRTTVLAGVLELAHPSALAASSVDLAPEGRLVCVGKNQTYLLGGVVNQRNRSQTMDAAGNAFALADNAVALFTISGLPSEKPLVEVTGGQLSLAGELTVRFARALPPGTHVFKLFRAQSLAGAFRQINIAGAYSAQGAQSASAGPGAEFVFDPAAGTLRARIR